MNRSNQDEPWEDWFDQLKNLEPAQPGPFFYTRLEARLKEREEQSVVADVLPWWLQRPSYALGALSLLIGLNVAVAVGSYWSGDHLTETTEPYTYEEFVSEYQLNRQGLYADE